MKKINMIVVGIITIAVISIAVVMSIKNKQVITTEPIAVESVVFDTALTTTYITNADSVWPPAVTFKDGILTCDEQGNQITENGKTTQKKIDNNDYCITAMSEGAAGSTYTTYTYVTPINNQLATTVFTLRFVQCENYDEPNRSACLTERANFSVDGLAHGIIMNAKNSTTLSTNTCYSYHQVATTEAPYAVDETLFISTNGNIITGTKQGTQNGPDMTNGYNGSITGTVNGDTVNAVFDYIIEGSSNKEQEIYKKTANGLEKLRYPLIQGKGMLVPDTTKEFKIIPYTQIACSSIK